MKEETKIGMCLLCHNAGNLCNSHIYPKFVVNWLKQTSQTGYFRSPTNINMRMQDGPKQYWFCDSCEQILSRDERKFSEQILFLM